MTSSYRNPISTEGPIPTGSRIFIKRPEPDFWADGARGVVVSFQSDRSGGYYDVKLDKPMGPYRGVSPIRNKEVTTFASRVVHFDTFNSETLLKEYSID